MKTVTIDQFGSTNAVMPTNHSSSDQLDMITPDRFRQLRALAQSGHALALCAMRSSTPRLRPAVKSRSALSTTSGAHRNDRLAIP
jgi:hypothetical protein